MEKNRYNLLYREEEREMIKFCNATGVAVIPVVTSPKSFVLSRILLANLYLFIFSFSGVPLQKVSSLGP